MSTPTPLFTNPQINLASLPSTDQLEMQGLEPAYKTVRYISGVIMAVVLICISWPVVLLETSLQPWGYGAAALLSLFGLWMILYQGISFHHMKYAVREKDIVFSSGWLWKYTTTIPFNRVQHCDIKQGLIDRQFGLARLTIYTAGGTNTDMTIPGLLPHTAEKLKVFILGSTEQAVETE